MQAEVPQNPFGPLQMCGEAKPSGWMSFRIAAGSGDSEVRRGGGLFRPSVREDPSGTGNVSGFKP